MSVEVRLRRVGEGRCSGRPSGQGGFVEFADVVEQQVARFADVAGALFDAGGEGDEGGFERAGQDDDLVVTLFAQFASDAPAFFSSNAPCPNGFSITRLISGIRSNTAIDHLGANASMVQPGWSSCRRR